MCVIKQKVLGFLLFLSSDIIFDYTSSLMLYLTTAANISTYYTSCAENRADCLTLTIWVTVMFDNSSKFLSKTWAIFLHLLTEMYIYLFCLIWNSCIVSKDELVIWNLSFHARNFISSKHRSPRRVLLKHSIINL